MWHPADRGDDVERIPLANEDDQSAAAVMGVWLGLQALEISRPDPAREDDEFPEETGDKPEPRD